MALASPLPTPAIIAPVPRFGSLDIACIDREAKSDTAPRRPLPSPSMPSARLGRMPATSADDSVVDDSVVAKFDDVEKENDEEDEDEEEDEEDDKEERMLIELSSDTREKVLFLPLPWKSKEEDDDPLVLSKYEIPPT